MASMPRIPLKVSSLGIGRTILLGGTVVAASFAGFYLNLRRIHNKKAERGDIPHYEYLLAHVASRRLDNPNEGASELPISRFEQRASIVPVPQKEHRSGHSTIADFKLSSTSTEPRARLEQPTPQRPKEPGSSVAYTKSPDYAKSYEKSVTAKPKKNPAIAEKTEITEVVSAVAPA